MRFTGDFQKTVTTGDFPLFF